MPERPNKCQASGLPAAHIHIHPAIIHEGDTLIEEHLLLHTWSPECEPRCEGAVLEDHAVTGNASGHAGARMHGKPHEARLAWSAHKARDLPVACNAPLGYLPDHVVDLLEE